MKSSGFWHMHCPTRGIIVDTGLLIDTGVIKDLREVGDHACDESVLNFCSTTIIEKATNLEEEYEDYVLVTFVCLFFSIMIINIFNSDETTE